MSFDVGKCIGNIDFQVFFSGNFSQQLFGTIQIHLTALASQKVIKAWYAITLPAENLAKP